ncbi:SPOC like C-terminal domain-containing protein [Naematelia encephala]|uniref:ATP-dependent DNA helicase II subunit 2 n=1 Tax=Naematelia encephala TaxID=71784 RepID=A0A1Y2ALE0_9TREE|nr:SPOC like C-terminal domain-containing protein [Naematelia encephala]
MSGRAGYTLVIFAIDVSPSMGEIKADPDGIGKGKSKLDLAKELVARRCEPKILSGRKTEAVGIVSFGGRTNNQANRAYMEANPDDEDPPYAAVACDVAAQTVKPKTIEEVINLQIGEHQGNRESTITGSLVEPLILHVAVSALMVALDMVHTHKHSKSWALEVVLITDGESAFKQDEYEDAMTRFDDLGVKLSVLGIDFDPPDVPVDKSKSRNKRLSEKFWRTFVTMLHAALSPTTSSEEILPTLGTFDEALSKARLPHPAVVNGTVSGIDLHIGSAAVDEEQAITIPIKFSKATMKARPPTLSKAWKPAMDLQAPLKSNGHGYTQPASSQLASSLAQQSQAMHQAPEVSDLAAMISADVKHHSLYVIKRADGAPGVKEAPPGESEDDLNPDNVEVDQEAEEVVAREDIVKAWRFGSTWVPMEADTFEPLDTRKGVEILGFFPREAIKRHLLMGEVRFVWPDLTSPKAQIQFSSLVEGMYLRNVVAVVRWVLKDKAEPTIGLCVPEMDYPGDEKRLDYMFWIKLPFAEDEHNFWFPSLTTYKTNSGKVVTEHSLLPTHEQCELMDELVEGLDLDEYAKRQAKSNPQEDGEEDMAEDEDTPRWFEPAKAYNPVIHRIKEAIFHASLTRDLDAEPLGPPHPELVKYFETPEELVEKTEKVTRLLKEKLDIKKVPPRQRKAVAKEGLREGEGYIDIDELFANPGADGKPIKPEPVSPAKSLKREPASGKSAQRDELDEDGPPSPIRASTSQTQAKPKRGRVISNEQPLEDFERVVEGEGDMFRKAIQDLGVVVKENIEASFSRQAFPLALDCLKAMRTTALTYEEVETYNDFVDEFESYVKDPKFKHRDFWDHFEKAGDEVSKITPQEARAALEGYDEE